MLKGFIPYTNDKFHNYAKNNCLTKEQLFDYFVKNPPVNLINLNENKNIKIIIKKSIQKVTNVKELTKNINNSNYIIEKFDDYQKDDF